MTQNGALSKNMRLLGHNDLGGFGNCGEGMAIQLARDGRRVLWLGHESAPKNFTAVDVTDPRKPSVIVQTDLPHGDMRSNNLDLVGDLAGGPVPDEPGRRAAGRASSSSTWPTRASRARSRSSTRPGRTRAACTTCGSSTASYLHLASGAPDFKPRNPKDDQFYRIIDVRQPTRAGRGRALVAARHA